MGSWAQAVIFPQKKQPGVAKITQKSNSYQLANKVLKASFINTGGKLYFNGCSELGLQPDTELFNPHCSYPLCNSLISNIWIF